MLTRINFYLIIVVFILLAYSRYAAANTSSHIIGSITEDFVWEPKITGNKVSVIIDSTGGDADVGVVIVNQIRDLQARGFSVHCFVREVAASAAFMILANCSKRYARPRAQFMWHTVRVMMMRFGFFDLLEATTLYKDLSTWQEKADALVRRNCTFGLGLTGFCPDDRQFKILRDKEVLISPLMANILSPCFIHGFVNPKTRKVYKDRIGGVTNERHC